MVYHDDINRLSHKGVPRIRFLNYDADFRENFLRKITIRLLRVEFSCTLKCLGLGLILNWEKEKN
jgi:hypothetical protein